MNFVAEVTKLPDEPVHSELNITALARQEVPDAYALDPSAFAVASALELEKAWLDGPYLSGESLFALRDASGALLGVGIAIVDDRFADPTKIDSAMPCFRLGGVRTESERTKRVNGLFSYVARPGPENHRFGRLLLGEARRRFDRAGLRSAAGQCPDDRLVELSFFRIYFREQCAFPVFVRQL
jgi:hypothetical protein